MIQKKICNVLVECNNFHTRQSYNYNFVISIISTNWNHGQFFRLIYVIFLVFWRILEMVKKTLIFHHFWIKCITFYRSWLRSTEKESLPLNKLRTKWVCPCQRCQNTLRHDMWRLSLVVMITVHYHDNGSLPWQLITPGNGDFYGITPKSFRNIRIVLQHFSCNLLCNFNTSYFW